MASRKRPQPLDGKEAPSNSLAFLELEACFYVEVISRTFDPNRVFLRRLFFTNYDKAKYLLVGFYPVHNYQPLVELGGANLLRIVLTDAYVATMAQQLSSLVAGMCRNEQFQCKSDRGVFGMNTTLSYSFA
jgi:hypothetical protein